MPTAERHANVSAERGTAGETTYQRLWSRADYEVLALQVESARLGSYVSRAVGASGECGLSAGVRPQGRVKSVYSSECPSARAKSPPGDPRGTGSGLVVSLRFIFHSGEAGVVVGKLLQVRERDLSGHQGIAVGDVRH